MTESISGAYLSLQAKEGALVPNLGYAGRAQRQTEYKLKEGSKSLWNTGESKILSGAPEVLERIKNKTKLHTMKVQLCSLKTHTNCYQSFVHALD